MNKIRKFSIKIFHVAFWALVFYLGTIYPFGIGVAIPLVILYIALSAE